MRGRDEGHKGDRGTGGTSFGLTLWATVVAVRSVDQARCMRPAVAIKVIQASQVFR